MLSFILLKYKLFFAPARFQVNWLPFHLAVILYNQPHGTLSEWDTGFVRDVRMFSLDGRMVTV